MVVSEVFRSLTEKVWSGTQRQIKELAFFDCRRVLVRKLLVCTRGTGSYLAFLAIRGSW